MKTARKLTPAWTGRLCGLCPLLAVLVVLSGCADRDLFEASASGRVHEISKFVKSDPGAVHARDSIGRTPLHRAAEAGSSSSARTLLEAGADPAAIDRLGFTPLDYARLAGATEIAGLLEDRLTLFEAVRRGEPELVDRLLAASSPSPVAASGEGLLPLHLAVAESTTEILAKLLRTGVDPNRPFPTGESPLQRAVEMGDSETVRLLLEAGADPDRLDSRGHSALYVAIGKGDSDLVALLLEHGADPNLEFAEGLTPIQIAAQKGRSETVERLLEQGARIDARNREGRDSVYWARKHRHYALAEYIEQRVGDRDR